MLVTLVYIFSGPFILKLLKHLKLVKLLKLLKLIPRPPLTFNSFHSFKSFKLKGTSIMDWSAMLVTLVYIFSGHFVLKLLKLLELLKLLKLPNRT